MTAAIALDALLVGAVLVVAWWTVATRRSVDAVIGFVAYGLLLALAWVRLGSVDVALTEAGIGAGIGGVLLLTAARRLEGREAPPEPGEIPGRTLRVSIALLSGFVTLGLAAAVLSLPDPAPSQAPAAAAALPSTGLGNPVTGVLLAYRALDTLLEAVVLALAVVGVWSLGPDRAWGGVPGPRWPARRDGPLALLARVLPPIGIVVGLHVFWTGADAPGGAFQGGAILAAMAILAWMAGLLPAPRTASLGFRWALVVGPLLFIGTGVLGALVAGDFLAWPEGFAKPLILAVEAALTLSIAAGLAALVVGPATGPATGEDA